MNRIYISGILFEFQKRKKKFTLQSTKPEFDFKPVYKEPSPEFFEFKPVVNDVFRALIAARQPKSTTQSVIDPENSHAENQLHPDIQENINVLPRAEVHQNCS